MLNYEVEPNLLSRYVPPGTALDSFKGRTYVSLVGFRFCRTKLLGCFPAPFHANFDEVNLRFYVRRKAGNDERRGVVFIAEVVPRRAIAATARLAYGENYICSRAAVAFPAIRGRDRERLLDDVIWLANLFGVEVVLLPNA